MDIEKVAKESPEKIMTNKIDLSDKGPSAEEVEKIISEIDQHFENEYQKSLSFEPKLKNTINPKYKGSRAMTHKWAGIQFSQNGSEPEQTGYDTQELLNFARNSIELPEDFNVHPRL